MNNNLENKLKPLLPELIQYYREELDNPTGGNLHIVLEDGNVDESSIWFCQEETGKKADTFGYFLATLMRSFTEDELEKYYENNWNSIELPPEVLVEFKDEDRYGIEQETANELTEGFDFENSFIVTSTGDIYNRNPNGKYLNGKGEEFIHW